MTLKLAYFGHPCLRLKAQPVEKVDEEVQNYIKDLIQKMTSFETGIGLASTQVAILKRIFVILPAITVSQDKIEWGPPEIYINPILSNPSKEWEMLDEGCLSIPGLYLPVRRPYSVEVEALNFEGHHFKKTVYGFHARQVMHENDHLNGVLFIDRVDPALRKRFQTRLDQIKKKFAPTHIES